MPSPGSCLPWGLGHPRVGSPAWTPDLVCRGASPPGAYSPCSEPFLGASQDPQPVAAEPSPLLPGPALGCTLAAPTSCTSAHWKPSPVPLQAPREHVPATATPATRMLKEGMGLPGALHCPLRPVGELGLLSRAPQSPVFESPPRPPPLLCGPGGPGGPRVQPSADPGALGPGHTHRCCFCALHGVKTSQASPMFPNREISSANA